VNRTFRFGLIASVLGVAAGSAYKYYLSSTGTCGGLFGVAPTDTACTTTESWTAFLNVFSMVTLAFTIVFGLAASRIYREDEGYVSLGDSFLAIGTLVSMIEVVVFALFGAYLGIAYGVAAVGLTLFALKQDRQTAMAVTSVMSLFVTTWMVTDPSSLLLGVTPVTLWILGALAYASSLKLGESLVVE